MNRQLASATVLSAALVLALAAFSQGNAAPQAAPAAQTEAAKPAIAIASGTYKIDPTHTMVLAQWNHMGFSNPTANFDDASGAITWDAANPSASKVEVTLPLSGLRAFSDEFNKHLAGADFFEVAKFPEARFVSTSVTANGVNRYNVGGDLTIKGITKPVTLDVTVNGAGPHPMAKKPAVGFDATARIKRSDFGLGMYAPAVSDEVTLRITTEAMLDAPVPKGDAK